MMQLKTVTRNLILAGMLAGSGALAADELERNFTNPPEAARPHVYWYWMDGNISREGITADLDAMQRAGIGGVSLFNIGDSRRAGPVKILSPEWRALMRHAIREAGRRGIEVNLNNSMSGWSSSGGPWITPELAMQKLTWSETVASGGRRFDAVLARPPVKLDVYRDVAVLAFPTPAAELPGGPAPVVSASDQKFDPAVVNMAGAVVPSGANWDAPVRPERVAVLSVKPGEETWVQLAYAEPFTARSLHVAFAGAGCNGVLQASEDGQRWRDIQRFVPRTLAPVDLAFTVGPARYWRVLFTPERKTTKISLARLDVSPRYRIAEWSGKAMFDPYGLDKPAFTGPDNAAPAACVVRRDQIVDLTDKLDATGRLVWDAPAGQWTILRFGFTPTGSKVCPNSPGGEGLECDKLNAAALDAHWKHSLQPWFDDKELNRLIQYVHVDSYERGAQNWTARLPREFRARRRYELRSHLPALTGRVVDSVAESERFLWDFRRTVTGLMHENYFGHMQQLCRKAGKLFTCEPYHQTQFNNVTAGGRADIPMCEAWTGPSIPAPYWMKLGASPAHVYGRQLVQAEAFTAPPEYGGNWNTDFWDIKELGDAMLCGGVNRMVFHVYAHQPWTNAVAPGQTLGGHGTHFERSNTWWEQMPAFTRYISRCQHLLQQGRFVADVLYSCGENSPNESLGPAGMMALPRGYDYDVCDPHVILNRLSVKDGRLTLPEGLSYRLLVLPDERAMTPEMVRKIGELVKAGAVVVGPKPTHSPSLTSQPRADRQVRALAETIWGGCDGRQTTERVYGKGRIYWGKPLAQILAATGMTPDFDSGNGPVVRYIHRRLDDGELYFVASSSLRPLAMEAAFRVADGSPQLWDPVTGTIRPLPEFRRENGRTIVPLRFEPRQSYFVVFRKKSQESEARSQKNFPELKPVTEIAGPWEVAFDPQWGGPERPVTFESLTDWTTNSMEGIKYYSGTAVYRKVFSVQCSVVRQRVYLDLGAVKNMAAVRVNGKKAGVAWCPPWRVEITGAIKPGANELEIEVVNTWFNRIQLDQFLPEEKRVVDFGYKSRGKDFKPGPKMPLMPAGLLGPVRVMAAE
jgi:hypothetical protein